MPSVIRISGIISLRVLPTNSKDKVHNDRINPAYISPTSLGQLRRCLYTVLLLLTGIVLLSDSVHGQTNFLRDLPDKGVATFEDGCRGIATLLKISLPDPSFEKLAQELLDRKIIRKKWMEKPTSSLTWGQISYMVYTALKIRGGVTITVIGPTERYAYRECIDKGLMPMGNKAQFLTGADLMAILYKAEVYVREH